MKTLSGWILGIVAHAAVAVDAGLPLENASKAYLAKGASPRFMVT